MEVPFLYEIVIIFLLSIVVTIVCNRLKLPATVGFLLTGVLCGPSLLGIVSNREAIDQVADIGVAMLLFTIGMELSGDALSRLKRPVFLGGSLQFWPSRVWPSWRAFPIRKEFSGAAWWPFPPRPSCCASCRSVEAAIRPPAAFLWLFWSFRTSWWPPCCSACPCWPAH